MNYWERHIGDYTRDTAHLSIIEHGVYTLLLDRYYATEMPIPADQAHRIARARTEEERAAVDSVLAEFFILENCMYLHRRCQEEIQRVLDKRSKAKASADARWDEKRKASNRNANAMQSECDGNANASVTHTERICEPHANGMLSSLQSPVRESKSGDAAQEPARQDPRKVIFDLGVTILGKGSRGLIAKALSDCTEEQVGKVLGQMAMSTKADPRAYFVAALKPKERGFVV